MYKEIKITKKYSIAFEIFNDYCKNNIDVYKTGIRNWNSGSHYTYSIVINNFRVMLYKENNTGHTCN